MTVYAHVLNGIVAEPLVTPPDGFSIGDMFHAGLTWVDVTDVSPAPEPGWTAAQAGTSWTFTPPPVFTPSPAQQAQAALMAGLMLVSTSTPALNGIYDIGAEARADLMAEMLSLLANGNFTNGTPALAVGDLAGAPHVFVPDAYRAFATGVGSYVGALKQIVLTNEGALPSNTLTIP